VKLSDAVDTIVGVLYGRWSQLGRWEAMLTSASCQRPGALTFCFLGRWWVRSAKSVAVPLPSKVSGESSRGDAQLVTQDSPVHGRWAFLASAVEHEVRA